jgi:hypothetical protein
MKKDKEEFWIRDYFGPYPIDWDLYDIAMGIKPEDKIIKTDFPNIKEYFDSLPDKIKKPK